MTFGTLGRDMGGQARGQRARLTALARACAGAGVPCLSVLVVRADTRMPSLPERLHHDLGLTTVAAVMAAQRACFAYDWPDASDVFPDQVAPQLSTVAAD